MANEVKTNDQLASVLEELVGLKDAGMMKNNSWAMGFTDSVSKAHTAHGYLTKKQWYWVEKLIQQTLTPNGPSTMEKASMNLGDYSEVYGILATGKSNLKWPKIWLQTNNGQEVKLALSGSTSKVPNTINVTDGKPFGQNQWWGRITQEGTWQLSKTAVPAEVTTLIQKLATDPVGVIKEYGKVTGNCCFCSKSLTVDNSVKAGFGPVCAKNYGLHDAWKKAVDA